MKILRIFYVFFTLVTEVKSEYIFFFGGGGEEFPNEKSG